MSINPSALALKVISGAVLGVATLAIIQRYFSRDSSTLEEVTTAPEHTMLVSDSPDASEKPKAASENIFIDEILPCMEGKSGLADGSKYDSTENAIAAGKKLWYVIFIINVYNTNVTRQNDCFVEYLCVFSPLVLFYSLYNSLSRRALHIYINI